MENSRWCIDCHRKVQVVKPPFCPVCGQPAASGMVCQRCAVSPPRFAQLRSWAVFGGVLRSAILRLKYRHDVALGDVFSRFLVRCFMRQGWNVDCVIPVPLGLDRIAERGYNQASLLARPFAYELGLDYLPRAVKRVRETRSQVGLSIQERHDNVSDAFLARQSVVSGRRILLIDDVTTTGSTLNSCAGALLNAGAIQVFGLTLARAA